MKLPAVRPVPKAYSLVVVLGARALQQVLPRWNSSPTFCLQLCSGRLRLPQARRTGPVRWGAELGDPRFREAGLARLYDGERVCPPRPIGRWRNARSGAQPEAAHGSREARDIPRIRETIGRRATQAPEQRVPQGFVVRRGIRCGLGGRYSAEGVIGSGSRAHGQQQPARFLTCTLFLRRAASSRAHDGYRAGAPGEDGHAARSSLKSGQGPSRLLRPGGVKEVRLSASSG